MARNTLCALLLVLLLDQFECENNETESVSGHEWLVQLADHRKWSGRHYENVSQNCSRHLDLYLDSLRVGKDWAAKVSDASGRYSSQFFFGNDFWLGSAKLCSEMQAEYEMMTDDGVSGEPAPYPLGFNVARLQVNEPNAKPGQPPRILLIGECLPSSCQDRDISSILKNNIEEIRLRASNGTANIELLRVRPIPGAYDMWNDPMFYIVSIIGITALVLIVIASVYEYCLNYCHSIKEKADDIEIEYQNNNYTNFRGNSAANNQAPNEHKGSEKPKRGALSESLLAFSVLSNTEKIMRTEESEDSITCIHGLRFLSLLWVIMVHTYLQLFAVADNKTLRTITERNFFYQTVGNASYSVDTFFFISGFLVTLLYYKSLDSKRNALALKAKKISVDKKETKDPKDPKYAFTNTMTPQTNGDTSESVPVKFIRQTCSKEVKEGTSEFLLMLFYRVVRLTPAYFFVVGINALAAKSIENDSVFDPTIYDHVNCYKNWWRNILYINNFFSHTEMCMPWTWYMANDTQFYIVGAILLIVSKRYFKFTAITLIALMTSSWVVTGYISLMHNYKAKIELPFEMFDQLYDKPWSRLGPYLIGMITGWYVHRVKGRIVLPLWMTSTCWVLALGIMTSLIYGMKDGYLEIWPTAFYVSIGHTAWGVAVAWVVLFCLSPQGSLLNKALSYRGMLPLSRLAYCAYLVHPMIMMICVHQLDGPFHLHNGIVLVIYAGISVMSYLLSFAVSVGFEAPVVRLLKIALSRK